MAWPSMDGDDIHGWQVPLVVKSHDEMYNGIYGSSCHPWIFLPSMDGRGPPVECIMYMNDDKIDDHEF